MGARSCARPKAMIKKHKAEPAPTREQSGTSLLPVITVMLGLMMVVQVLLFALRAYRTLSFPYQIDYGEGPILQIAMRVAQGETMYPPVNRPPYAIASYEPLYYLLCALGVKLLGPGFLFGRLISFASTLAIAGCAGAVVWRETKHRFAAFLAGGLILAMPHVMVWSTLLRIDLLAIALAVVGYCVFTGGHRLGGIPLFALGVFTRRTDVAAMGAAFVGDARQRGWRPALRAFAAQVGLIALLLGGAALVTRGAMVHQLALHTASSLGKAWSWEQLWSLIWYPLRAYPAYFAITLLGAAWCAARRERRPLFVFFAFACVIFLTGGRIGSAHNYLIEPMVVGAMMFGMLWADLSRTRAGAAGGGAVGPGGRAGDPDGLDRPPSGVCHQPFAGGGERERERAGDGADARHAGRGDLPGYGVGGAGGQAGFADAVRVHADGAPPGAGSRVGIREGACGRLPADHHPLRSVQRARAGAAPPW